MRHAREVLADLHIGADAPATAGGARSRPGDTIDASEQQRASSGER
jgi:hypothetical protein